MGRAAESQRRGRGIYGIFGNAVNFLTWLEAAAPCWSPLSVASVSVCTISENAIGSSRNGWKVMGGRPAGFDTGKERPFHISKLALEIVTLL